MYGLEAISAYNGWAMALAGALIVFSGLVILSTVISQLHKVLSFFERQINRIKSMPAKGSGEVVKDEAMPQAVKAARFLEDVEQVVDTYQSATKILGDKFALADLYRIAGEIDAPHPHLTISYLRQHRHLVSLGDGVFSWRQ